MLFCGDDERLVEGEAYAEEMRLRGGASAEGRSDGRECGRLGRGTVSEGDDGEGAVACRWGLDRAEEDGCGALLFG
jgi:hypothetical protein